MKPVPRPPLFGALVFVASLASLLVFSGCSGVPTTAAAPRSSVPRERALSLASLMARSVGGEVFTIAPTGSMKPTLDETSVVTIERVDFGVLRQGDIIIYRNARGLPIIHRLYEQHGARWLVLGDNNGSIDPEAVTRANFVGRVCAIFYTAASETSPGTEAFAQR